MYTRRFFTRVGQAGLIAIPPAAAYLAWQQRDRLFPQPPQFQPRAPLPVPPVAPQPPVPPPLQAPYSHGSPVPPLWEPRNPIDGIGHSPTVTYVAPNQIELTDGMAFDDTLVTANFANGCAIALYNRTTHDIALMSINEESDTDSMRYLLLQFPPECSIAHLYASVGETSKGILQNANAMLLSAGIPVASTRMADSFELKIFGIDKRGGRIFIQRPGTYDQRWFEKFKNIRLKARLTPETCCATHRLARILPYSKESLDLLYPPSQIELMRQRIK